MDTSEYNQTLSQRRATAAVNYLVSQRVDPARLAAVGRGAPVESLVRSPPGAGGVR